VSRVTLAQGKDLVARSLSSFCGLPGDARLEGGRDVLGLAGFLI
jgi:hypothetical protein